MWGRYRMKRFLVFLAILLLMFSLAGCKEDVQELEQTGRPSTAGSADADVEEASSGSSVGEKITDYISKKQSLEFTVDYQYTMDGPSGSDTWDFKQYMARNRYRMDSNAQGQEGRFYFIDNQVTSCNKQGGDWTCMQLPQGDDSSVSDPTEQFSDIEDDIDVEDTTYKGTRKIAGTTAYCWGINWDMYGADGGMDVCYSKEGVPLYMKSETNGMTVEMEAKSYKTSVSDSDFRFPAEPMDMGAMMAQAYGGQMPEGYEMPDY